MADSAGAPRRRRGGARRRARRPARGAAQPRARDDLPRAGAEVERRASRRSARPRQDVREHGALQPPKALRDAHYPGAKKLGHGEGYVYPPDDPAGYDVDYLPDELKGRTYYEPGRKTREAERLRVGRRERSRSSSVSTASQGTGCRFRRLAEERLADRFHVVAADLRGHGHSDLGRAVGHRRRMSPTSLETFDRPAYWIGHSFGGRLTMERGRGAARARPARGSPRPGDLQSHRYGQTTSPPTPARKSPTPPWTRRSRRASSAADSHTPRARSSRRRSPSTASSSPTDASAIAIRRTASATRTWRWRSRLRRSTPCGSRPWSWSGPLSKIVGAGEIELYKQALGDLFTLEVVPGGHSVLWDAFDETAAAIDAFLEG